ncbi:MAG: glycerate kinase [Nitrospiraceae bacterium]|nr:glycerate kinase [Nitrospiraceae bacterium]MDA8432528.1 glycerate kinase [Nitrospiraceae bacterium]
MVISAGDTQLEKIFRAALRAADPYKSVRRHLDMVRAVFTGGGFSSLLVAGFGKASCPMAQAVEDSISDIVEKGIVVTKYRHCEGYDFRKIAVREAGHPLPDENGRKAAGEIIGLLRGADKKTLVLCLISGGGSALLVSPCEGITLSDKQEVTELLLKAGAGIHELNAVRKHLSGVKGGRLAEAAYPARVLSLIISDVIGDDPDVIASGPTSSDGSTYADALAVLEKYGLRITGPRSVIEVLEKGASGLVPETPKAGQPVFDKVENIIIGGNRAALEAAKKMAGSLGFDAEILSSEVQGEAREVGQELAKKAIGIRNVRHSARPVCLISGGETTVTVRGSGLGGRNMELALAFALGIDGVEGISFLSAGTDGTDGPTDATGAIVNGSTVKRGEEKGVSAAEYLANNDSYNYFKEAGGLLITGPTGTNVMDVQVIAIK